MGWLSYEADPLSQDGGWSQGWGGAGPRAGELRTVGLDRAGGTGSRWVLGTDPSKA